MRLRTPALALVALGVPLLMSGCGREASLDRPAPLVGPRTTPAADTTTRHQNEARARRDADERGRPRGPQSIDEVRNLGLTNRENPVQGSINDPNAPHTQGVLPDPDRPSSIPQ